MRAHSKFEAKSILKSQPLELGCNDESCTALVGSLQVHVASSLQKRLNDLEVALPSHGSFHKPGALI